MTAKGKGLEAKLRSWLSDLNIYYQRFYDSRSFGRIGTSRPADFWVWLSPKLIFIEAKELSGNSMPFDRVRPSQYKAALLSKKYAYKHILLISTNDGIWALRTLELIRYIKDNIRKSIPVADIKRLGAFIKDKLSLKAYLEAL